MRGEVLSGVWFDRTAEGDARRCGRKPSKYEFASRETLKLSPPPVWDGIEPKEACRRVCEMVCEVVAETSAALRERGERPLGVQRILRQHPHSRPIALKRSPAPRFHASSWDVRKRLEEAYKAFLVAYRQAAAQLRSGDLGVEFPAQVFPSSPSFRQGSDPHLSFLVPSRRNDKGNVGGSAPLEGDPYSDSVMLTMRIGLAGRSPPSVGVDSIFWTTSAPAVTLPKTGCLDGPGENQSR